MSPPGRRSILTLHAALSSSRWEDRLAAIETIRKHRDVRFARRLWLLSRFHLAPAPVRQAARETYRILTEHQHARSGQLSPTAAGQLSKTASRGRLGVPGRPRRRRLSWSK